MKATIYKGRKEKLMAGVSISRCLPNPKMKAIGSVVFLDHVLEKEYAPKKSEEPDGNFAHPHKGIATFSYLLDGGVHHLDSAGGEGVVYSGGLQWMNAGNGIIHDEFLPYDFQESGGKFHALQFWLNLPSKQKAESPGYIAVQSKEIPTVGLPDDSGVLKILLGEYEGKKSEVPNYLEQFIYHIHLKAGNSVDFTIDNSFEYGLYVIDGMVKLEDSIKISEKEIAEFSELDKTIQFKNESDAPIDIMFFGGESYTEPMVSYGPFIMNTEKEIATAYSEYQNGKYGEIDYSRVKL